MSLGGRSLGGSNQAQPHDINMLTAQVRFVELVELARLALYCQRSDRWMSGTAGSRTKARGRWLLVNLYALPVDPVHMPLEGQPFGPIGRIGSIGSELPEVGGRELLN